MTLSGRTIIARNLLTNLLSPTTQRQPCGVDLTLKSISHFTGPGTLDFSNALRQTASTERLPSSQDEQAARRPRYWSLEQGCYAVAFNEMLDVKLDCVGSVYPRSSLWRTGVGLEVGVCDAGYLGALGGLLVVSHPHGIKLYENARIA